MADTTALAELGFLGGSAIAGNLQQQRLKEAADLAQAAAQTRQLDAHARYYDEEAAGKAEERRAQALTAAEFLRRRQMQTPGGTSSSVPAGAPSGAAPSLATPLLELSDIALGQGNLKQGMTYAKDAANVLQSERAAAASEATRANALMQKQLRMLSLGGQLLTNVTDQASANLAEAQFVEATGQSLFEGRPYSPDLVKAMQQRALTVKEAAELKLKTEKEAREKELQPLEVAVKKATARMRNARADQIGQDKKQTDKAGGKPENSVTPEERNAATSYVKTLLPDLDSEDTLNTAYSVASRAKNLRRTIPGLSQDGALRRVVAQMQSSGEFELEGIPGFRKQRFKPEGKSPDLALPLPDGTNPALLKPNTYYQDGGEVRKWNGKTWEAAK